MSEVWQSPLRDLAQIIRDTASTHKEYSRVISTVDEACSHIEALARIEEANRLEYHATVEAERGPPREPSEAVLAEREACARFADEIRKGQRFMARHCAEDRLIPQHNFAAQIAGEIATAIRGRSAPKAEG